MGQVIATINTKYDIGDIVYVTNCHQANPRYNYCNLIGVITKLDYASEIHSVVYTIEGKQLEFTGSSAYEILPIDDLVPYDISEDGYTITKISSTYLEKIVNTSDEIKQDQKENR